MHHIIFGFIFTFLILFFIFSSTAVLTFSIDVVFTLSILTEFCFHKIWFENKKSFMKWALSVHSKTGNTKGMNLISGKNGSLPLCLMWFREIIWNEIDMHINNYIFSWGWIYTLKVGDTYMYLWTRPLLDQIVAWCLVGHKPLPEPMLTYCELDT